MKKILSVESNPIFRVYSHHAYMHAIAGARTRVAKENDTVAEVQVIK